MDLLLFNFQKQTYLSKVEGTGKSLMEISSYIPNLIANLIQAGEPVFELKPGWIVPATVTQIDTNSFAMLEIHGVKLRAIIPADLNVGDKANLLVTGKVNRGAIELKLVSRINVGTGGTQNLDMDEVLKVLDVPKTKDVRALITELLDKGLPVRAEEIEECAAIFKQFSVPNKLPIMSKMIELGIPILPETFKAITTLASGSEFHELLENTIIPLQQVLDNSSQAGLSGKTLEYLQKLDNIINRLLAENEEPYNVAAKTDLLGVDYEQKVVQVIKRLGVKAETSGELENQLHEEIGLSLKPLGLLLQEKTGEFNHVGLNKLSEGITALVNHITAQQLITQALQEKSGTVYRFFCVPAQVQGLRQTIQLQILARQGARRQTIDPGNCYILIHLDLCRLGELDIHMNVTDKTVGIRLVSENPSEFSVFDEHGLKSGLQTAGFKLGSLSIEGLSKERVSILPSIISQGKFDRKI